MKRVTAILICLVALGAAMVACGGGGSDAASAGDKLTIVGSGS
jgi:hypothetical protein